MQKKKSDKGANPRRIPEQTLRSSEGHVGIFWLVGSQLIIDATALSQAGNYGEFAIHEGDHITHWSKLQQLRAVPTFTEYEEYPRGRVVFNRRSETFILYADRCILRLPHVIEEITGKLGIPRDTRKSSDPHYRCSVCLCSQEHD